MALTVIGKKCGMTRHIAETGVATPVTVIYVEPNRLVFSKENSSEVVAQVTVGEVKSQKLTKPLAGHFKKYNVKPGKVTHEIFLEKSSSAYNALVNDKQITASIFNAGDVVKVTGTSKGKGFSGVIKRYHFAAQDATHGNSLSHRAPGSIGQRQTPGRVFKGKKMAGRLGNEKVSVKNLKIISVIPEKNLVLVQGSVPGAPGNEVYITLL